jgi:hypothetical protein
VAKKSTGKVNKIEWQGYLNVNLSAEDEAIFDAWEVNRVFSFGDVTILADNGYKFSLAWDDRHNGIVASLYASNNKLAWPGWTLTAWAADVETAVRLLFFKHYSLCEEDWERFTGKVERMNRKYG